MECDAFPGHIHLLWLQYKLRMDNRDIVLVVAMDKVIYFYKLYNVQCSTRERKRELTVVKRASSVIPLLNLPGATASSYNRLNIIVSVPKFIVIINIRHYYY